MKERVQQILTDLERVQENLLALSDDIWLNIEHNDSQALQKGFEFKLAFNGKLDNFNQVTSDISTLIEHFTHVSAERVDVACEGTVEHDRIIRELDSTQPHTIDESFTYKRPYGFVFMGQAYKGVSTWKSLYKLFCVQLAAKDINRFKDFIESSEAKAPRGGAMFATEPTQLRSALEIAPGIYAEGNLSANSIRDRMKSLLVAFEISFDEISFYLREDRNAVGE
ncbi:MULTISPECIES: hypothetical protein [Nostocales]|uniref:Uncharacterized protein n=2 Tax=Tolypothrix TaxID=111782 RepID=A0A0C1RC88_9CYAN